MLRRRKPKRGPDFPWLCFRRVRNPQIDRISFACGILLGRQIRSELVDRNYNNSLMLSLLLLIAARLLLSNAYQTTITSNFSSSPTGPAPVSIYAETLDLVSFNNYNTSASGKVTGNLTFPSAFPSIPSIIMAFSAFVDKSTREYVNVYLVLKNVSASMVTIQYADNSTPVSYSNIRNLKVNVLAYNNLALPNIQNVCIAYQFEDPGFVADVYDYTDLLADSAIVRVFPVGFFFDLTGVQSTFDSFNIKTDVTIIDQNYLTITINASFVTDPAATTKSVTLQILVYRDTNPQFSATFDEISTQKPQASIVLSFNTYYLIGLRQFQLNSQTPFDFQLSEQQTQLINIPSGSQIIYQYMLIVDASMLPDPAADYHLALTTLESYSTLNSSFRLVYENISDIQNVNISQFTLNTTKITIYAAYVSGNKLYVYCTFNETVENLPLNIQLKWVKGNVSFTATTDLALTGSPALKIYSTSESGRVIAQFSEVIQYLYLGGWGVALFSRKLIGAQLISFIQLAFFGLISLDTLAPTVAGLTKMNLVSGINVKFTNLQQVEVPLGYSLLGIQSNFLSNVNLMLVPIPLCLLISGLLYAISIKNTSYKHKPRLLLYSTALLCQWPFVLYLFNSYNVYSSLVVDVQFLGTQDIASLIVGVAVGALPLAFFPIYVIFKDDFQQFTTDINKGIRIGSISVERSRTIARMYPLVIMGQTVIIPASLASETLMDSSLYIVLVVSILPTVYAFVVTPYDQTLNNIRLLIHRILVNLLVVFLIVCKKTVTTSTDYDSPLMNLPCAILALLIADWLVNVPYILWKHVAWMKKPGVVDMKLYLEKSGSAVKPELRALMNETNMTNMLWVPRHQFALNIGVKGEKVSYKDMRRHILNQLKSQSHSPIGDKHVDVYEEYAKKWELESCFQ